MCNRQTLLTLTPVAVLGRIAALTATLMLGACAQMGDVGLGSGLASGPAKEAAVNEKPASELDKATEYWAKENTKNPRDTQTALNYARNLKAQGRKQDALAVLQNSYLFSSENREFLSEYGRLALELDQVNAAAKVLERADDPAKPDWRVISARGTVLAKQGDYKGAIGFFERARELAPSQPSLMNNLAMAYTMDGQAEKAEQLLRQAVDAGSQDPRVRQNLAMVVGLQGRHQEMRTIRGDEGEGTGDEPVGLSSTGDPGSVRPAAVASASLPKPQPAVARSSKSAPAMPAAASKPMEPDDIIRAAIEQDMARKKQSTPIATAAAAKRKASAAAPVPAPEVDAGPRLRQASQ